MAIVPKALVSDMSNVFYFWNRLETFGVLVCVCLIQFLKNSWRFSNRFVTPNILILLFTYCLFSAKKRIFRKNTDIIKLITCDRMWRHILKKSRSILEPSFMARIYISTKFKWGSSGPLTMKMSSFLAWNKLRTIRDGYLFHQHFKGHPSVVMVSIEQMIRSYETCLIFFSL